MRPRIASLALIALLWPPRTMAAGGTDFGLKWSLMTPGDAYDRATLELGDFDRDGGPEMLVAGCQGACWIVLGRGGAGFRQLAVSLPGTLIEVLHFARLPGGRSVVLASRGSVLEVTAWNGVRPWARTLPLGTAYPEDFAVVDLEGDGDLELVVIDAFDLHVRDWATGALVATRAGFGGMDLDVGDLDADSAPELAIANGSGGCRIVDGATLTVDWEVPTGFGRTVIVADLVPGDDEELVSPFEAAPFSFRVRAWDPPALSPRWASQPYNAHEAPAVGVGDLDAAAGEQVLVGGTDTDVLDVLDGSTGARIRVYGAWATLGFVAGDVDLDGALEVAFVQFFNTWYESTVTLLDAASGAWEHATPTYALQSSSVAAGDLDLDGDLELVTGAWTDGLPEGPFANAMVLAGADGAGPLHHQLSDRRWWWGAIHQFRIADLEADGDLEVCATYSVGYSYVTCRSTPSFEPLWTTQLSPSPSELLLANVVGDGAPELVSERHWSYSESYLDLVDPTDGSPIWTSPNLAPGTSDVDLLCVGPIDSTAGRDLVAGDSDTGQVTFVAPVDGSVRRVLATPARGALECADLDGDGRLELVAADDAGRVGVLDPQTGAWAYTLATTGGRVHELAVGDLLDEPGLELVVLRDERLKIHSVTTGAQLWSVSAMLGNDWYPGSLEILDTDGDDRAELAVTCLWGIAVFGRPPVGPVVFADGFESGATILWSTGRS